VIGSPIHAVFTAATGAGVGAACATFGSGRRSRFVLIGLAAAIVQHAAWNGLGARWLDTSACAPHGAACALPAQVGYWLIGAPAIVGCFIAPGVLALWWLAQRAPSGGRVRHVAATRRPAE
jgi:hypothetical protein